NKVNGGRVYAVAWRPVWVGKSSGAGWTDGGAGVQRRRQIADVRALRRSLAKATAVRAVLHRVGKTSLPVSDTGQGPATQHGSKNTVARRARRKHNADGADVPAIEVGVPVVRVRAEAQNLRSRLE